MTGDRARLSSSARALTPMSVGRSDEALLEGGIVVRDMRTNERFWVHDLVVDEYGPLLGADVFAIYCSLSCMANKDQYCWPSLSRLARHWGKGRATVVRAVTLLSDLKLIHVQRGMNEDGSKANNVYYLLEPLPIEEGLASLVGAFRSGGCTLEEAIERAADLVPRNWEPLRRKNVRLRSRSDWSSLLEATFAQDPERLADTNDGRQSMDEPGSLAGEPGSSLSEPGGSGTRPRGFDADRGHAMADQAGFLTVPPEFARGPRYTSEGTSLVPSEDPKDTPTKVDPAKATPEDSQHQGGGGVVLRTDDEISAYELADDEVLLETDDSNAAVTCIRDLARADIEATARNWGVRVSTEVFYSARQFLGQGEEDWTPEEEQKRSYLAAVRRDLEDTYAALGAFSVAEALSRHFTKDLVQRYVAADPEGLRRIHGWLAYVNGDRGKGIENVAGFLRTRIESRQWPPSAQARRRER